MLDVDSAVRVEEVSRVEARPLTAVALTSVAPAAARTTATGRTSAATAAIGTPTSAGAGCTIVVSQPTLDHLTAGP